jgi:RNA 3'-terminal phosphate cyclase (ATP)
LVIQALLPILSFGKGTSAVTIEGGTDVPWSPGIDYVRQIMIPGLSAFGVRAGAELGRRGHYPRGGGRVTLNVEGVSSLLPYGAVKRGEIKNITGLSHCTNLPQHVARRQADAALEQLRECGFPEGSVEEEVSQTQLGGPGSGILLIAQTDGVIRVAADALGARGKRAEEVGREAADHLVNELKTGMAADRHMGDMAIIYMASAAGISELGISSVTPHTETMMWLSEVFLGVKWESRKENTGTVLKVEGAEIRRTEKA